MPLVALPFHVSLLCSVLNVLHKYLVTSLGCGVVAHQSEGAME